MFRAIAIAVGLAFTSAVALSADKVESKDLIGNWKITAADVDGIDWEAEALTHQKVRFTEDGLFKFEGGQGLLKSNEGTFAIDAAKKPKTIDLTPSKGTFKGKAFVGIYEVTGNKIKICCGAPGLTTADPGKRPKKFVPKPEFGILRMTLEKVEE